MLNRFPGDRLDAVGDSFLVDVQANVVNTLHGSLLMGLTRGDLFDPAAHYELSAIWRLPLLITYAFKHSILMSPIIEITRKLHQNTLFFAFTATFSRSKPGKLLLLASSKRIRTPGLTNRPAQVPQKVR
jgi:hypothetical protein